MEPSHVGAAKCSSNGQLKVMGTEEREGPLWWHSKVSYTRKGKKSRIN